MLVPERVDKLGLKQQREKTLAFLESTHQQVVAKLSAILGFKAEAQISEYLKGEKDRAQTSKTSNSLVGLFLQMVEITDEYLVPEDVRQVLKAAFQSLTQKYITALLLRGKEAGEVELLIEKLKFIRKYFPEEYESLLQEVPR